eukprot:3932029-Pyramimonas_sp.AAC.1
MDRERQAGSAGHRLGLRGRLGPRVRFRGQRRGRAASGRRWQLQRIGLRPQHRVRQGPREGLGESVGDVRTA